MSTTSDWKGKLKEWATWPNLAVAALLVVSLAANGYLLFGEKGGKGRRGGFDAPRLTVDGSTAVVESPYGVRSEVRSRYEDGKWRTYSTSAPLTEEEAKEMREAMTARHKAMTEYFRKQGELMDELWRKAFRF